VVLVVIGLYIATTHDRWRWKRTLFWSGGTVLVFLAVGLGVLIAIEEWNSSKPQKVSEFWGLRLGATRESTIAMKGEPEHRLEDGAIWIYAREGGHYHVGFQNEGIRYVLFDFPRRPSQPGPTDADRSAEALFARFGEPSFISIAKRQRSRLLNFARFNMVFRLVNDQIATVGIYDPALGPIRYEEEAETATR
jgi:hypothetical protein